MNGRARALIAAGVALAVTAALAGAATGPAWAQPASSERPRGQVLVFSVPTLSWQDVVDEEPPALSRLLARSAVASMSVRTLGPTTTLGEAYATMGAGNRATADDSVAGLAFPPTTPVEGDAAAAVFERRCGCAAGPAAVLHLGIAPIQRVNEAGLYAAEPGALGSALAGAARRAAVVANADRSLVPDLADVQREASLAVMDTSGRVAAGSVGSQLVAADPTAPFGVRTDPGAVLDSFRAAWDEADVVLVEAGDLDRVDAYTAVASAEATRAARARAVRDADEALGAILADVDLRRDLVVVVGPVSRRGQPAELTVAALAGPGFEPGLARSATTRRDGYLTLPDLAPTVLDALGIEVPPTMTGGLASSAGGTPPGPRVFEKLAGDNRTATFRDEATSPVTVAFVVFQLVVYALAVAALTRWSRFRGPVTFLALMVLAVPALAFLSGLVPYEALGVAGYIIALFAAAAGVAGAALAIESAVASRVGPARPLVAPLVLVGLVLGVLLVDVVALGGRMQINTVLGYSPTVAGRFAGYGNLAFALVAMSALVLVTGLWGSRALCSTSGEPRARRSTLAVLGTILGLVVVVDGHPALGSDVGGVLAMVPGFLTVGVALTGARFNLRRALAVGTAALATLAVFAAIDLARPAESRTHLGRLLSRMSTGEGEGESLLTVLARKANANLSILTSSVWTLAVPVALALVGLLVWRRRDILPSLDDRVPGLRACLLGALVVGGLGFALNDSGVAVPAMMLGVLLAYLSVLVVRTADR